MIKKRFSVEILFAEVNLLLHISFKYHNERIQAVDACEGELSKVNNKTPHNLT